MRGRRRDRAGGDVHDGSSFRVGEARGHLLEWPEAIATETFDPWVLATTHPSAVLRAEDERQATYDALVADLRVAAKALKNKALKK
ncbi:hypothetical protein [Nocardioides sp. NPDC047086]|uniref:hypothetical protein n=1 Tax=Nocardioides sp. NPDC047086 TaxID=3154810 RepID=UPI00341098F1